LRAHLAIPGLAACAALGLALGGGAARAHGGGDAELRPVLDALPPALAGMRVELRDTLGWQLVLANPTPRSVEVLDEAGVPFLRIGPGGVEGNLAAPALYRTLGPASAVPAALAAGGAPRWQRTSDEPSAGWFDPRLAPPRDGHGTARRFAVPLEVDGERVALAGRFEDEPAPTGRHVARLTSPSEPVPGVHVTLLPGRAPGLLVRNASGRTLLVLGADGEPFLRIAPDGVEANFASRTWQRSARSTSTPVEGAALAVAARAGAAWHRVSPAPRFAWVDPRALATSPPPEDAREAEPRAWSVPMQLGERRFHVRGVVAWRPLGGV